MRNYEEYTEVQKIKDLAEFIDMLLLRIPKGRELETCKYKGIDLLNKGTEDLEVNNNKGVLITTEELEPFIVYLENYNTPVKEGEVQIKIAAHSNSKLMNNNNGVCDSKCADYGELTVSLPEKEITIYLNYMDPKTKLIGHYVKVQNQ